MLKQLWLYLMLFSLALVGCEQEGPAERAGEEIDEAVQEVEDTAENACEEFKEGVKAEDQNC